MKKSRMEIIKINKEDSLDRIFEEQLNKMEEGANLHNYRN
jgi:hypothetical protein